MLLPVPVFVSVHACVCSWRWNANTNICASPQVACVQMCACRYAACSCLFRCICRCLYMSFLMRSSRLGNIWDPSGGFWHHTVQRYEMSNCVCVCANTYSQVANQCSLWKWHKLHGIAGKQTQAAAVAMRLYNKHDEDELQMSRAATLLGVFLHTEKLENSRGKVLLNLGLSL